MKVCARGITHFLEVNPLAGLHPEHSDLPILCTQVGISYKELIAAIMDSALKRVDTAEHQTRLNFHKNFKKPLEVCSS